MLLNPFWDWSPDFIALPVWLIVLLVFVLFFFGTNFLWLYRYLVMRPVAGHGIAARAGNEKTQQVLMFGMNRAFTIQALDYMEKVLAFHDTMRIARWLQTSPYAVGMLGYKSIMLLTEIFDHPKDPIAEMAICAAAAQHNADMKELCGEDKERLALLTINNYRSYTANRRLLEQENPDGVYIPIYGMYDPGWIFRYTPENRTAGQFGRTILKDANDLNSATTQKSTWEKAIPLFICLAFGIVAIALCYMFVTQGGSTPAPAGVAPALTPIIPGVEL